MTNEETPCLVCGAAPGHDEGCMAETTLSAGAVLDEVAKVTSLPAYVEQTGGGTATIYIGTADEDGYYPLAMGPGTFHWGDSRASTFYLEDFSIGFDDGGESDEYAEVKKLEDVGPAVEKMLVARAADFIRKGFGSMREDFLSDPGGYLSQAVTDEDRFGGDAVWAKAIDVIEAEWKAAAK